MSSRSSCVVYWFGGNVPISIHLRYAIAALDGCAVHCDVDGELRRERKRRSIR